jgi:P27 family predicted phage terminase small subunit
MGRRGPPPKPRAMKLLEGTFRPDRAPKDIPKPPKGAKAPKWLGKDAKTEWNRIGPWLEAQGLLTKADEPAFAIYCDLYGTVQEFRKLCRKVGAAVSIQQGYRNVLGKATLQLKQYLALFGLSPADRERIGVDPQVTPPAPGSGPDDDQEKLLFGHQRRA